MTKWIRNSIELKDICPVYRRKWLIEKAVSKATLKMTALGVYVAKFNGERVGRFVLAPGWTAYEKRLQVQSYDVTEMLKEENTLEVIVGKGWYASPMPGWLESEYKQQRKNRKTGLYAQLSICYMDGTCEEINTDTSWEWQESQIRFSEIYDGETFDARPNSSKWLPVSEFDGPTECLIPQEGEEIQEQERLSAKRIFLTPMGETVVDFGQEITGYTEFVVDANDGDKICIQHGEMLDKDGNFYRTNYRSAKAEINYTCTTGEQTWHPQLTFFGFRYLKLVEFPGVPRPEQFTAIAVYSKMKPTGWIRSGNEQLNQLVSNIFWSQKGNFLDVPTDCPQRDERLGWTGDAAAFVCAASYNYHVEKFFRKWLRDLKADQRPDGGVGSVIPDYLPEDSPSAAWGDAATIVPWQLYQTYGDDSVLHEQFDSMKAWVDYITSATTTPFLWTGGTHFGDWLGLDAPRGSYKGSSREDFIASAYYAYSTSLLIKAGRVLGADTAEYEILYQNILQAFQKAFPEYQTQTECVLAVRFGLAADPQKTAAQLADMIKNDGVQMRTGFVGTPHILHVLSDYGYATLAYDLLLRREYPSWLYAVDNGATTVWEHWDGIMQDGSFWSADMNSFNHYAYGAAADWLYEKAAGIQPLEPGFSMLRFAPYADSRLGWLDASVETVCGKVRSKWNCTPEGTRYELETPVPAQVRIEDGQAVLVQPGSYIFWGENTRIT